MKHLFFNFLIFGVCLSICALSHVCVRTVYAGDGMWLKLTEFQGFFLKGILLGLQMTKDRMGKEPTQSQLAHFPSSDCLP